MRDMCLLRGTTVRGVVTQLRYCPHSLDECWKSDKCSAVRLLKSSLGCAPVSGSTAELEGPSSTMSPALADGEGASSSRRISLGAIQRYLQKWQLMPSCQETP